MKTIYIDTDFKAYISNDGTRRAVTTDVFDDKCPEWIEGHRLVPAGETWIREDGVEFRGTMCTAWKSIAQLEAAQRQYEREQLADMRMALNALGVNVDG